MYFFKDRIENTKLSNTLGLDIATRMLRWVILKPKDVSYEFKNYAIEAFPITKKCEQLKDVSQIVTTLKRSLTTKKEPVTNCVVNIPDDLVCSKYIQVDCPIYENLDDRIKILVERSIPYPLNSLYFDYQVFDSSQNQDNFKVLLVACRKEHLDLRLDIIDQANLIPIAAEVSSHAIERAYKYFYPLHENHMLLDVGACQLTLLFLDAGQNTISYSESLLDATNKESILLQIKRCIKRYYLAYPYNILTQLVFLGPKSSLLKYLIDKLNGFLDLKIQELHELKFKCSNLNSYELNNLLPSLFLSYGLALKPYYFN